MDQQSTQGQDIVKKAQALVDEINNDNAQFMERTGVLVDSMNKRVDELEHQVVEAEKNLNQIEEETGDKLDVLILESLQEEDTDID